MSKKSFLVVADASTVIFNADQAKNFQVTLAGNRALKVAGGQEGDEISILLVQGGSGSYVPTWSNVTFEAGEAPNLATAVGASDLVTLVKKGSTWKDVSGAPSKLPARIGAAALATMTFVNSVGMITLMSAGAGTPAEIGRVGNTNVVKVGTGADATVTIVEQGSGGYLISSSGAGIGIGVPNLKTTSKITDANLYVNREGELTGSSARVRGNLSGSSLTLGGFPTEAVPCFKTDGEIGYRTVSATGTITAGTCQ